MVAERQPSEGSIEDDVRWRYLEARRDEHTFEAMRTARMVAEAVCKALIEDVPEDVRQAYRQQSDLHKRIGFLEDLVARERQPAPTPKAVLAALRTLQAYGNYASHYEQGTGSRPPMEAANSAIASLTLVARWFLTQRSANGMPATDDAPTRNIALRQPPLPDPRILERRRILRRAQLDIPTFNDKTSDAPSAVLGSLFTYYAEAIKVCERICIEVIDRETEVRSALPEQDFPLIMQQIAEARPTRVPLSVAADVSELWRRRAACERAIASRRDEDVEPLIADFSHRKVVDEIVRWFKHDYLRSSSLERHWWVWLVFLGSMGLIGACRTGWIEEGRSNLRDELVQRHCSAEKSPICAELTLGR